MTVDRHSDEIARLEGLGAAQAEPTARDVEQMSRMTLAMIVEQQAVAPDRNARSAPLTVRPGVTTASCLSYAWWG